jgi:membrane protease subunit HflK
MSNDPNSPNRPFVIDLPFDRPPKMPKIPRVVLVGIAAVILMGSSYYQVAPFEQAVVLRFGQHVKTVGPGPRLKLPFIDEVLKVPTERQLKEEFGFRTISVETGSGSVYDKDGYDDEALMLTGDLAIAEVEWVVQYRIVDPMTFLFEVRSVVDTIRAVSEAEMRGVVGDMSFEEVIKEKRNEIEETVRARMNEILEAYDAGVEVRLVQLQDVHPPTPVKDSFEEVNRALQEMERAINEAERERNKVIFRVEGEALQRVAQAEGRKVERINRAEGDATRFESLLVEYRKAPEVTRRRLHLEAMREVLPQAGRVVIVDDGLEGMLPILDLAPSRKPKTETAPVAAGGAQ